MTLRMTYLTSRVDDKLTSVVCVLRFAKLSGADMGWTAHGAKTYSPRSGTFRSTPVRVFPTPPVAASRQRDSPSLDLDACP